MSFTSNILYFKPIFTIATMLAVAKIPFHFHDYENGAQLSFPWCDGTLTCHQHTIGTPTYVQSENFYWDRGYVSMLEIDEAIHKIINYYREKEVDISQKL